MKVKLIILMATLLFTVSGCSGTHHLNQHSQGKNVPDSSKKLSRQASFPAIKPKHVVIVIEENHSRSQIIGNANAPYINRLARQGARFSHFHAITHPSQPNYLDLFSGSDQGVTSDSCPHSFSTPNLGSELIKNHLSFAGYAEDLPYTGFTGCNNAPWWWPWGATYARKHSPWVNFTNVPASDNLPFNQFPSDFTKLPTVSFVIPNLNHDMHNGTVKAADTWLHQNLGAYIKWAKTHNSLFILTWDENDRSKGNHIATLFVGQMVKQGTYSKKVNDFNLLRTIEDMYGLSHLGRSANAAPLTQMWK